MPLQPQITTDPRLERLTAQDWSTTPKMIREGRPTWSTRYVAETFLGISRYTLVAWLSAGKAGGWCPDKRPNGAYVPWRLCDVEWLAYALADSKTITVQRLRLCMVIVQTVAEQYGFI